MERKTSPIATGLAVAAVLGVLLVGYFGAYWWRSAYVDGWGQLGDSLESEVVLHFPTTFETVIFAPAVWLHQRVHRKSFGERAPEAEYMEW